MISCVLLRSNRKKQIDQFHVTLVRRRRANIWNDAIQMPCRSLSIVTCPSLHWGLFSYRPSGPGRPSVDFDFSPPHWSPALATTVICAQTWNGPRLGIKLHGVGVLLALGTMAAHETPMHGIFWRPERWKRCDIIWSIRVSNIYRKQKQHMPNNLAGVQTWACEDSYWHKASS